jgi:hypothetical protein
MGMAGFPAVSDDIPTTTCGRDATKGDYPVASFHQSDTFVDFRAGPVVIRGEFPTILHIRRNVRQRASILLPTVGSCPIVPTGV